MKMEHLDKVCVKVAVLLICSTVLGGGHVVNWEDQGHEKNDIVVSRN